MRMAGSAISAFGDTCPSIAVSSVLFFFLKMGSLRPFVQGRTNDFWWEVIPLAGENGKSKA
jgi:hypothetical protein